ncbi:retrovirus-related pol polyprotein from transposon TNT 1-94 [Tanacetum coccineum]
MKKVHRLLSMTNGDERKHVLDYTHVDLHYVEDQRKNLVNKFNLLKQEISLHNKVTLDQLLSEQVPGNIIKAFGGKGRRKEKISSKEVVITKADKPSSVLALKITSYSESECDSQEPLPPLPKLIGAAPSGTSENLISLSDLALNMVDLTLDTHVPKTRPSVKVVDSSTEQLLLTLMEEVKGLKRQIEIPSGTPPSSSQPICGSITHEPSGCPKKHPNSKRPKIAIKQSEPLKSRFTKGTNPCENVYAGLPQEVSGPKVVFGDDSLGDTEGNGLVNCNGITFTRVAYVNGTIYNQNDEVILIAPRRRDVYVIDMSSFNKESNACFFDNASSSINWLWYKRLSYLNFKNINNLAKHNLVSSLPSLTFSKDKNYLACEKRKHHRASFKTKRSFFINKPLHLLHMDLFGPVKPQTISHNKYTLVIVDEYSRYTWVFCFKKKSDAADYIMSFIRKMENLNEVRVKELRSDNETEFRERSLDISYFYVFRCPMHIHNHRDHLGKFDEKADDGFFLGYSSVAKAFKVFNIRRQEMEETVHVTFSEDDEAISHTSTEGDEINFNESQSFPDDEFL